MTHEQFTQIYLPLCGKMYALAYTLLRNRNAARDCVQDVYAELWENRDTMETSNALLPRVLNMVRNNCRDRLCAVGEHVCDITTTDAPIVIVNVIINEEHHYHEGSIHMDIRDSFITE